tara:strand:- start:982 stop:1239 length:258 start_codon:yes stop_codon:yes gene_type:complete
MEHLAHQQVDGLLVAVVVELGVQIMAPLKQVEELVAGVMVLLDQHQQQQEQMALEVVVGEVLNHDQEMLVVTVLLLSDIRYKGIV